MGVSILLPQLCRTLPNRFISLLLCPLPRQVLNWELYSLEGGKRLGEWLLELLDDVKGPQILTAFGFHQEDFPQAAGSASPQINSNWPTGTQCSTCFTHTPPPTLWAGPLQMLLTLALVGCGRLPMTTCRMLAKSTGHEETTNLSFRAMDGKTEERL